MFWFGVSEMVVPLVDFPQSSIGAPCPAVIATEHTLILIFFLEDRDTEWDGTTVRMVDAHSTEAQCAIVHFERPSIHSLGPPNDEAFGGHRLANKGLQPYGAFEVVNSEWTLLLEKMNSIHPQHQRARFLEGKHHFIITFHDSVFECIARGYRVELKSGSISKLLEACAQAVD